MTARRRPQLLAAPVLGERGGGIGQVSQLLWRTMRDEWGSTAAVLTLLRNGDERPDTADKWRFGIEIARRQLFDPPQWILFSHLGLARVARYIPDRWATPYAVFLHGIECWAPLPADDLALLRHASLRVANSAYTANRALAANPGIGEIAVCPLALPDGVISSKLHTDISTQGPPMVLMVGRLSATERYKGHEQLIRCWPQIEALAPGARLTIVGDGDDAPRLKALAQAVSPRGIEFTGFLSRASLDRRYAEASLFALPSRGEGFGVVYLEAMATGVACLGSVHDAASEVIAAGETGELVDPDKPEEMVTVIARLLCDPHRTREMGRAGRDRLLSHFSYEQFRDRMAGLLRGAFSSSLERSA